METKGGKEVPSVQLITFIVPRERDRDKGKRDRDKEKEENFI